MSFITKTYCGLLILLTIPVFLSAQKKKEPITYKYTIKAEGGRHKVGLPLWKVDEGPLYPTFLIGVEDSWPSKKYGQMFQAIEISGFHNNSFASGYFLSLGLGFRLHTTFGSFIESKIGIGFIHVFRPRPTYSINANGEYERIRDFGEIRPSGDAGISIGQTFMKKRWQKPISLYVNYKCLGQMFFNDRAKVLPQTFGSVGIKFHFKEQQ